MITFNQRSVKNGTSPTKTPTQQPSSINSTTITSPMDNSSSFNGHVGDFLRNIDDEVC